MRWKWQPAEVKVGHLRGVLANVTDSYSRVPVGILSFWTAFLYIFSFTTLGLIYPIRNFYWCRHKKKLLISLDRPSFWTGWSHSTIFQLIHALSPVLLGFYFSHRPIRMLYVHLKLRTYFRIVSNCIPGRLTYFRRVSNCIPGRLTSEESDCIPSRLEILVNNTRCYVVI